MKSVFVFLFVICAAACSSNPAGPSTQGPIHLTATINRSTIGPGEVATVTFRLENSSSSAITLDFNSACQVMPFIAKRPANGVVYPAGGAWGCAQVITQLTLAANSVTTTELQVRSGVAIPPIVGLGPGQYAFFARLDDRTYRLESGPVMLTVN